MFGCFYVIVGEVFQLVNGYDGFFVDVMVVIVDVDFDDDGFELIESGIVGWKVQVDLVDMDFEFF